jgi:transcription antitermination factor NusG
MSKQEAYENHLDEKEPKWFAVYTRSKSEKAVKGLLDLKNIPCYLPLQTVTRRYTRKIKVLHLPLIRGYVFVKITKGQYVPVLETDNVVNFLRFNRNLLSIPEREIDIMKRVVGEAVELEVEPLSLQQGDKVEIIGGKLTGLQGRLVESAGKKQMVIELENVGFMLKMTVDVSLLRRVI